MGQVESYAAGNYIEGAESDLRELMKSMIHNKYGDDVDVTDVPLFRDGSEAASLLLPLSPMPPKIPGEPQAVIPDMSYSLQGYVGQLLAQNELNGLVGQIIRRASIGLDGHEMGSEPRLLSLLSFTKLILVILAGSAPSLPDFVYHVELAAAPDSKDKAPGAEEASLVYRDHQQVFPLSASKAEVLSWFHEVTSEARGGKDPNEDVLYLRCLSSGQVTKMSDFSGLAGGQQYAVVAVDDCTNVWEFTEALLGFVNKWTPKLPSEFCSPLSQCIGVAMELLLALFGIPATQNWLPRLRPRQAEGQETPDTHSGSPVSGRNSPHLEGAKHFPLPKEVERLACPESNPPYIRLYLGLVAKRPSIINGLLRLIAHSPPALQSRAALLLCLPLFHAPSSGITNPVMVALSQTSFPEHEPSPKPEDFEKGVCFPPRLVDLAEGVMSSFSSDLRPLGHLTLHVLLTYSSSFRRFLAEDLEPRDSALPLLQSLFESCAAEGGSEESATLGCLSLLLLSQYPVFVSESSKVKVEEVEWYSGRDLSEGGEGEEQPGVSLSSLWVLVLLRAAHWNYARAKNMFLNAGICGCMSNLATQGVENWHWYAASRVVDYTQILAKTQRKLNPPSPIIKGLLGAFSRLILTSLMTPERLSKNSNLVYSLIRSFPRMSLDLAAPGQISEEANTNFEIVGTMEGWFSDTCRFDEEGSASDHLHRIKLASKMCPSVSPENALPFRPFKLLEAPPVELAKFFVPLAWQIAHDALPAGAAWNMFCQRCFWICGDESWKNVVPMSPHPSDILLQQLRRNLAVTAFFNGATEAEEGALALLSQGLERFLVELCDEAVRLAACESSQPKEEEESPSSKRPRISSGSGLSSPPPPPPPEGRGGPLQVSEAKSERMGCTVFSYAIVEPRHLWSALKNKGMEFSDRDVEEALAATALIPTSREPVRSTERLPDVIEGGGKEPPPLRRGELGGWVEL